ncbi:MAG: hypothetical protein EBZ51_07105 [Synechococcaceae bacterium WB9_2_112]|jgi:hypothetical protein|nr:hypothetical protein [Synechococcaceae bacterium WB9_2_112]
MSERMRVEATRLAGLESRAVVASGVESCWARVSSCLPALDAHPLDPQGDYAHKIASMEVHGLRIGIGLGSPFRFAIDDHSLTTFLLSCGGRASVRQGGNWWHNGPEVPGLFLPGEACVCEIRNAHGYVIAVPPERLAASALVMAESRGLDSIDLSLLQRPMAVGPLQASTAHVLSLLRSTLHLLDLESASAAFPRETDDRQHQAPIADLICRQLCALLIPSLVES